LEIPIKALTIALYVLEAVAIAFFLAAVYLPHVFGGSTEHVQYWPVFGKHSFLVCPETFQDLIPGTFTC
jgi:hypothetical protein